MSPRFTHYPTTLLSLLPSPSIAFTPSHCGHSSFHCRDSELIDFTPSPLVLRYHNAAAEIDEALRAVDSKERVQVFNKHCKVQNMACSIHKDEDSCMRRNATCALYDYAKKKRAEKISEEKGHASGKSNRR